MASFITEAKFWADQLKILLPFKYVAPIIGIHYLRKVKMMYITVPSPDKIDVKESLILLQVVKTIMYKATNNLPIPTTLAVEIPEVETSEMTGEGKPIVPILYDDNEGCLDWCNTILYKDKVLIEVSYETSYYENKQRYITRYYRLRNLGSVLSVGFRFFKSLTETEAFVYAHFAAFIVHQICNRRFKGPGPFGEPNDVVVLDNIERPFDPALVRDVLRQSLYATFAGFDSLDEEDIEYDFEDFCERFPDFLQLEKTIGIAVFLQC